jgi:predicted transcriptional regulator
MKSRRHAVSPTELELLKVLWELGPSTIRSLTERLYPRGGTAHYATVQKLLERLEAKRCVRRRAAERAHVFVAAVDRPTLIARRLRETAEELCDGSLAPLLTHLVDATKLTTEELAALRELVEGQRPPRRRQ